MGRRRKCAYQPGITREFAFCISRNSGNSESPFAKLGEMFFFPKVFGMVFLGPEQTPFPPAPYNLSTRRGHYCVGHAELLLGVSNIGTGVLQVCRVAYFLDKIVLLLGEILFVLIKTHYTKFAFSYCKWSWKCKALYIDSSLFRSSKFTVHLASEYWLSLWLWSMLSPKTFKS